MAARPCRPPPPSPDGRSAVHLAARMTRRRPTGARRAAAAARRCGSPRSRSAAVRGRCGASLLALGVTASAPGAGRDARAHGPGRPDDGRGRRDGPPAAFQVQSTRRRPYRPAESGAARRPSAVDQVVLPDEPDDGYIVVYEFPDPAMPPRGRDSRPTSALAPGGPVPARGAVRLRQVGRRSCSSRGRRAHRRTPTPAGVADALDTIGERLHRPELTRARRARLRRSAGQSARCRRPRPDLVAPDLERVGAREVGLGPERATRRSAGAGRGGVAALPRRRSASGPHRSGGLGGVARGPRHAAPGASTTASIRPGCVSSATESRMPAIRSAFSRSSGYTLNPLGRTMMSFVRPWR